MVIDLEYRYLIDYFWRLRGFLTEYSDCINPALVKDWSDDLGILLSADEKAILYAMDSAFRVAMANEVRANDKRRNDHHAAQSKKGKR